jgi:hypothetical protein
LTPAAARALLSSLPAESRNIPRCSRALVIDRLRAAGEALLPDEGRPAVARKNDALRATPLDST